MKSLLVAGIIEPAQSPEHAIRSRMLADATERRVREEARHEALGQMVSGCDEAVLDGLKWIERRAAKELERFKVGR